MIGAIIGAGLSIASSVAGGIANRKAAKKQAAELRRQEQRQKAYYDRVMGEDATQRADAQRLLTMTQDEVRRNNRRAEAMQAVMDYMFDEVGVNRVESRHDPRNANSGAVMRKCGMKFEGTLRQSDWNNQGICDASWYGVLAEERNLPKV